MDKKSITEVGQTRKFRKIVLPAILKNGRHLGFSSGMSDRFDE